MKPEDKQRLKRFWQAKVLLLTSAIIGSVGIAFVTVPFLQSQCAMVQEAEVPRAMNAFSSSVSKDLKSTVPEIVFNAADTSVRLRDKSTVPLLLKHLDDSNPYVRRNAALALGQLRDKSAVPLLLKHLDDSDASVRRNVALALGQLRDKSAVLFLLEILRDKQSPLRFEAFSALKKLSESGQVAHFSQPKASLFLILGGSLFLGTVFVGDMGLIFFLLMRNPYPLSWSGHLLLPEETIAELIALKRRRQKQNFPQWKLNLELTTEVLSLLWAIHIQVRLQKLSLPPSKKRNID
jgi:HEAT repeats